MFEAFEQLVGGSPATYPVIVAAVAVDAFFPVVPGETVVITAAVVASGHGGLAVWVVGIAALAGAFLGDNLSYLLGAKVGRPAARRLFGGGRSRSVLSWANRQLRERGALMILGARFVPGGRTAVTFSSGMLDMEWRRFALADAAGSTLWAVYATALGYFGGAAFRDSLWKPLAISLAVAGAVAVVGEVVRRLTEREEDRAEAGRDVDQILGSAGVES